ncbi:hypothetical protein [Opitutus sp. GAS368]|uniref:hypothetical protein n=1 Tax=Opitutus sp. GAS368 TaxID=1882749 RepID=UPI00087CCE67|nr:hypothetical protein [Opitutus sp. GAS368]SDS45906.1 hypothetical protein SAMN05444173_2948 [Opitutus sp. GAS368]
MVKKGEMLVVGTIKATPMERFGRNQRRAAAVAPQAGSKPGVIRFRTWEDFAAWKEKRAKS